MDTSIIVTLSQHWRAIVALLVAVLLVALVLYVRFVIRRRQRHDAVSAKPLGLNEEQEKTVTVKHRYRAHQLVYRIPAALTTYDVVYEWAALVRPRLSGGYGTYDVETVPSRLWHASYYEVVFSRLDDLRSDTGTSTEDNAGERYVLGEDLVSPKVDVSVPRSAHLAIIGESNSGKGSVIANIITQEVAAGGEVWFIDLKGGMEAEHYKRVLTRKAYTLDEAEQLLADFNDGVDERARQWRGKTRTLTDREACHRLLVIDEAADLIKGGALKKQSDHCVELIRSILSRSRALNCTVVVATQNPRVSSSLPYRSLLLTTLALRLNSKSEAVMALGEDAVRQGARPWQISFNRPGDGYLWDAEANAVRFVHVPFVTDEEIHGLHRREADGGAWSGSGNATPDDSEQWW